MDIKVFALVALIAVLGSFTEARAAFGYPYGHPYGNGGDIDQSGIGPAGLSRLKREIDNSNGESTTTQATTTISSTTDPTTTPSSTTPSSTTPSSTTPSSTTPSSTTPPSTTPSTTPTTTTEATSPTTTPSTTSASTPTSTSTTPTTPTTTPEPSTTTPESTTEAEKPKGIQSRSNSDEPEPEDSTKKPESPKNNAPTPGPYFGAPGYGFSGYPSPSFDPYFGYPGFNSIPSYSPNYAWTGTNNGPGYASAGASAGSFAYPGMEYPMGVFPTMMSPTMELPTELPTGSPSFGSRGGFQDNSPNQDNSLNKDKPSNQNGYNFGGDPLYNSGPGFFYPGQFPSFNDPTFDMIKRIQAQIEAQHQANMDLHNRLASNYGNYGNYGGGEPQVASASIGLGPYGGFQSGQISPAAPGIESRFADDLPPPSGNSFGVFASSSSSSMTGPDGRPINHKSSITGVNDNGRISYRTVHD